MTLIGTPVATTCNRPEIDRNIHDLITSLVRTGLTVRRATEEAARRAAAAATRKGWRSDLVDFVVIRTADLGAQLDRAGAL